MANKDMQIEIKITSRARKHLEALLWWSYRQDAYSLCRDLTYQINKNGGARQRYEGVPFLRRVMNHLLRDGIF
jgi:hypothetical protein